MKSPANCPPRKTYGAYTVENNEVTYATKDDYKLVCSGWAWVDKAVRDQLAGHLSYLVRVVPVIGEPTTIRIVPKDMASSTRLQEMIGNLGVIIHEPGLMRKFLLQTASDGNGRLAQGGAA